jgi:hypothetical protein
MRSDLELSRELQRIPSALPVAAEVLERQESLRAEAAGQQQAAAALGRVFGDGWVLLRGYRNQAGQIDLILGRRGLIAVQAAHLDATVICDGDDWRAEKYGEDGSLIGQDPLADGGGRSPGRQVGEPADQLEQLLTSRPSCPGPARGSAYPSPVEDWPPPQFRCPHHHVGAGHRAARQWLGGRAESGPGKCH